MDTASFCIIEFSVEGVDTTASFPVMQVYSGILPDSAQTTSEQEGLYREMRVMNCGEKITLGMSWDDFRAQWLAEFVDSTLFHSEQMVKLHVRMVRAFSDESFRSYCQSAAQQAEMEEHQAIELVLMNELEQIEQHGKLYIVRSLTNAGDSIRNGYEVHIRYHTCLLNGVRLDSLTEMTFPFGKPGQLIPGLQYGLSFLRGGEKAVIYMPSYLAFGEQGSSTGIVPRHTPIYFEVEVRDVRSPWE